MLTLTEWKTFKDINKATLPNLLYLSTYNMTLDIVKL